MHLYKAKLVIKSLKQNKNLQERYRDAYKELKAFLKDQKKKNNKDSKPQEEKTTGEQPKAIIGSALVRIALFAINTFFSTSSYLLVNSFILNCSFLIYICNNFSHFDQNTFQKLDQVDPILIGDSYSYVEGYSEVKVNINTPAGK